jgi:hypothetical protein
MLLQEAVGEDDLDDRRDCLLAGPQSRCSSQAGEARRAQMPARPGQISACTAASTRRH